MEIINGPHAADFDRAWSEGRYVVTFNGAAWEAERDSQNPVPLPPSGIPAASIETYARMVREYMGSHWEPMYFQNGVCRLPLGGGLIARELAEMLEVPADALTFWSRAEVHDDDLKVIGWCVVRCTFHPFD